MSWARKRSRWTVGGAAVKAEGWRGGGGGRTHAAATVAVCGTPPSPRPSLWTSGIGVGDMKGKLGVGGGVGGLCTRLDCGSMQFADFKARVLVR